MVDVIEGIDVVCCENHLKQRAIKTMFVTLNHAVHKNYHCIYTVVTKCNLSCRMSHNKATNTAAKDSVETDKETFLLNSSLCLGKGKGKADPLQAWSGPEGSRKLRFPDFMTTAQDGGKVVSLTHRPPLPQEILLVLISVRG